MEIIPFRFPKAGELCTELHQLGFGRIPEERIIKLASKWQHYINDAFPNNENSG